MMDKSLVEWFKDIEKRIAASDLDLSRDITYWEWLPPSKCEDGKYHHVVYVVLPDGTVQHFVDGIKLVREVRPRSISDRSKE